jgi:hypothetical protein
MERQDLERLTREQLITQAERLGIPRPRVLTQPELVDEIIGRTTKNDRERAKARGWLGRARDLLASVVERGLHLPEAARALRKGGDDKGWPAPPPPLPTVTLAEIYAAQGHLERALAVLDEVLVREPDHREARLMRERFAEQAQRSRSRSGRDREPLSAPSTQSSQAAPEPEKKEAAPVQKVEPPAAAVPPVQVAPVVEEAPPSLEAIPVTTKAPSSPPAVQATRIVIEAPRTASPVRFAEKAVPAVEAEGPPTAASATIEAKPVAVEAPAVPPAVIEAKLAAAVAAAEPAPAPTIEAETEAARSDLEAAVTDRAPAPLAAPEAASPVAARALPLVEEPWLPDRYEVDEIVAIAVDPRTLYLYWEVRPVTLAHARAGQPDGWLCVRVASVTATWEGPAVDTRDLRVDALYGDRFVRDVQPGSNVRVSVGWRSAAGFDPFAVGSEVTAPRAVPVETVSHEVARWEAVPVVAAFQNPRADGDGAVRAGGGGRAPGGARDAGRRPFEPAVTGAGNAFAARASAVSRGLGGPVDTGVALWGSPAVDEVPAHEEIVDEAPLMEDLPGWFEPGGSSELGRGGPQRRSRPVRGRRLIPGVPGWPGVMGAAERGAPVLGGGSELYPGGASELGR